MSFQIQQGSGFLNYIQNQSSIEPSQEHEDHPFQQSHLCSLSSKNQSSSHFSKIQSEPSQPTVDQSLILAQFNQINQIILQLQQCSSCILRTALLKQKISQIKQLIEKEILVKSKKNRNSSKLTKGSQTKKQMKKPINSILDADLSLENSQNDLLGKKKQEHKAEKQVKFQKNIQDSISSRSMDSTWNTTQLDYNKFIKDLPKINEQQGQQKLMKQMETDLTNQFEQKRQKVQQINRLLVSDPLNNNIIRKISKQSFRLTLYEETGYRVGIEEIQQLLKKIDTSLVQEIYFTEEFNLEQKLSLLKTYQWSGVQKICIKNFREQKVYKRNNAVYRNENKLIFINNFLSQLSLKKTLLQLTYQTNYIDKDIITQISKLKIQKVEKLNINFNEYIIRPYHKMLQNLDQSFRTKIKLNKKLSTTQRQQQQNLQLVMYYDNVKQKFQFIDAIELEEGKIFKYFIQQEKHLDKKKFIKQLRDKRLISYYNSEGGPYFTLQFNQLFRKQHLLLFKQYLWTEVSQVSFSKMEQAFDRQFSEQFIKLFDIFSNIRLISIEQHQLDLVYQIDFKKLKRFKGFSIDEGKKKMNAKQKQQMEEKLKEFAQRNVENETIVIL